MADREVARNTVQQIIDKYRIKIDEIVDDNERNGLNDAIETLTRAVQNDTLNIYYDERNELQTELTLDAPYTGKLANIDKITFGELNGRAYVAMRTKKESDIFGKMYAILAAISKLPPAHFELIRYPDLGNIHALGTILLNAS